MNILKNTTDGIYPLQSYQQTLWDKISQGGFKRDEMMIFSAGRQTGKSMYMNLFKTRYYSTNLCKEILMPTNPVKQEKYKFSRATWHEVELPGRATWRFSDEYNTVIQWCTEQFGPHPESPDAWSRWWVGLGTVKFRDAKDYEWFLLRWSK